MEVISFFPSNCIDRELEPAFEMDVKEMRQQVDQAFAIQATRAVNNWPARVVNLHGRNVEKVAL